MYRQIEYFMLHHQTICIDIYKTGDIGTVLIFHFGYILVIVIVFSYFSL